MALNDDLQACGLAPTGEPPSVTVDLAGFAVGISYVTAEGRVTVEARAAGESPDGDALAAATLAGTGDTRVDARDGVVVARRTLVSPGRTALYDTTFELAKTALSLARPTLSPASEPAPTVEPVVEPAPAPAPAPEPVVEAAPAPEPVVEPEPVAATTAPTPAVAAAGSSFWFFVDQPQPLYSPQNPSDVLAMLQPGTWYEARDTQGDWVYARHPSGAEGWVAAAVVVRQ